MIGCKPLSTSEITSMNSVMDRQRDKMLLLLGTSTGFRISELLSIKIADLLESNGDIKSALTVARRFMKGQHKSRSIPLSKHLQVELSNYIKDVKSQEYLFASRQAPQMTRTQAWRVLSNAAKDAGVIGKVGSHSLRKTMAKRIFEASGKNLVVTQKALGHSNINSTVSYMAFYTEQDINDMILKTQGE